MSTQEDLIWPGQPGAAVLHLPEGTPRAGIVALHGAADGSARQPLFDHLAEVLDPLGVAVLAYERRAAEGGDVPLAVQAADAVGALTALRSRVGGTVGVLGFSQGAWAAALAAADETARFLIVLGCSGVSPAEQMRFATDEALRRRGFPDDDRAAVRDLRLAVEGALRQEAPDPEVRAEVDRRLADAAGQPWFPHAALPPQLPPPEVRWDDMDHDPRPSFAAVRVPVLAVWGSDEEAVPRAASLEAWRAARPDAALVTLPGCGHWPAVGSADPEYPQWGVAPFSPDLDNAITSWLEERVLRG